MATIQLSEVSAEGGVFRWSPLGPDWERIGPIVRCTEDIGETVSVPNWEATVWTVPRPTLQEEAERLLGYWEQHGDNPEAVARWAITDMLGILRYITEGED